MSLLRNLALTADSPGGGAGGARLEEAVPEVIAVTYIIIFVTHLFLMTCLFLCSSSSYRADRETETLTCTNSPTNRETDMREERH